MEQQQNLHPSVKQFKAFVKEHPLLLKEVSDKKKTLQEFFEEWTVLGGEHEQWQAFRESIDESSSSEQKSGKSSEENQETKNSTSGEVLGQIFGLLKRMNVQDLQAHMAQFSSVLANIQQVMQNFQKPNQQENPQGPTDPFSFRRD
ncbi:YlbD family protein [Bacillus solitudinis]|uniref:YlbD family protein n=1 Tax=Bacillus solitudinis TaxID=2014074 RepID=UPI000C23AFD0|nr:YlbD family protein [Bacillus solitudinis]